MSGECILSFSEDWGHKNYQHALHGYGCELHGYGVFMTFISCDGSTALFIRY